MAFKSLAPGLPVPLHAALLKMGIETPTSIQAKAIPAAIDGSDVLAMAQTGSGKTAAFLIPIILKNLANPGGSALILAPTRELALQIDRVLNEMTAEINEISSVVIIGGASVNLQRKVLSRKPNIIVATPGRLIDLLRMGALHIASVTTLVIDEADRMMDMGFLPQVRQIVNRMTKLNVQTLFFSATFPMEVRKLANDFLKSPVEVRAEKQSTPPAKIIQRCESVQQDKKSDFTLDFINANKGSILIFTRTKNRANRLHQYLDEYGVEVSVIHGDKSQAQRSKALDRFREGSIRVLVATDVASRGLDVPHVEHVLNYDLPEVVEDYIHRIGRTGRAGRDGNAFSLVADQERGQWAAIARQLKLNTPTIPFGASVRGRGFEKTGARPSSRPDSNHKARSGGRSETQGRPDSRPPHRRMRSAGGERNEARPERANSNQGSGATKRFAPTKNAESFGGSKGGFVGKSIGRPAVRPEREDRPSRFQRPERGPRADFDGERPKRDGGFFEPRGRKPSKGSSSAPFRKFRDNI